MFRFQPRWKEELVVSAAGGSFVLEFPMGIPSAYLPTEEEWQRRAPAWAAGQWQHLHAELAQWCHEHGFGFVIEPTAQVYDL